MTQYFYFLHSNMKNVFLIVIIVIQINSSHFYWQLLLVYGKYKYKNISKRQNEWFIFKMYRYTLVFSFKRDDIFHRLNYLCFFF